MSRSGLTLLIALALIAATGCDNVEYIKVEPEHVTLRTRNDSVWMKAMGKSQTGREYPEAAMSWSMKDESIAKVDETGKVTPLKSGQTELVVKHDNVTASIPVQVLFAEKIEVEPKQLTLKQGEDGQEIKVKVYDFRGREIKDRMATFHAKNQKVVSTAGSKAFPLDPGTTQVEVRIEELTQLVDVTVEADKTARK
jgi:hypothetical protein